MTFRERFFPKDPPTEQQLGRGRRAIVAEGAVAAVIYSIGTGNFLAGYLSFLGASIAFCAAVAMIPQFGCVLQFLSPFLFERLRYRKLAVWVMCLAFRFSVAGMVLVPLLLGEQTSSQGLGTALGFFIVGFGAAGLVTPGLQHMVLGLAPQEHRGSFFARKDIIAICVNSVATLVLGRQLDYFTAKGEAATGFLVIGIACLALAALDAVLLALVYEQPVEFVFQMRPADILRPARDGAYRPVLLYFMIGGLMSGIASPFLSVYQLRVLGLSHTFITSVGVVAAVAGMAGSWAWGRYADRASWSRIIRLTSAGSLLCTLGWAFTAPQYAHIVAPVLLTVTAACAGGSGIAGLNLQYAASPEQGKTTYIGFTTALASLAACASAAVSSALQPTLQALLGDYSIPVLFLAAGIGGFANLLINARRLPDVK